MVSKWLGRSKLWPAALVSDADFAAGGGGPSNRVTASIQPRDDDADLIACRLDEAA